MSTDPKELAARLRAFRGAGLAYDDAEAAADLLDPPPPAPVVVRAKPEWRVFRSDGLHTGTFPTEFHAAASAAMRNDDPDTDITYRVVECVPLDGDVIEMWAIQQPDGWITKVQGDRESAERVATGERDGCAVVRLVGVRP